MGIASSAGNSYMKGTEKEKEWETGMEDKKVTESGGGCEETLASAPVPAHSPHFLPQTPETQELPAEEARMAKGQRLFLYRTRLKCWLRAKRGNEFRIFDNGNDQSQARKMATEFETEIYQCILFLMI